VAVDCQDGVATIHGRVTSATQARALADLVLGHDGVTRVESHLSIEATTPAGARLGN
jgi:osmotically-inducible protein OsmY